MHRLRRTGAVAASILTALFGALGGMGAARAADVLPSSALVEQLGRGEAVDLADTEVQGGLDLRSLTEVARPFHCRRCRFTGPVRFDDVVFRARLDLSSSTFAGPLVADGATFEGAAVFGGSSTSKPQYTGDASFSGAVFKDLGDFLFADFAGAARFVSTRFEGDAGFDGAHFGGPAVFEDALFGGRASFEAAGQSGCFEKGVDFLRTSFSEVADFRQRCFGDVANFSQGTFGGSVEMRQTNFAGAVSFNDARLTHGGSFLGATFGCRATFDAVTVSGRLDFTGADFKNQASFFRLAGDDRLVLDEATFNDAALAPCPGFDAKGVQVRVVVTGMTVHRLSMDLGDVRRVGPDQEVRVLSVIEDGARADGDIDAANKARYRRQVLEGDRSGGLKRWFDVAIYRWGAGYFLRPLRPAAVLAVLVLALALYRHLRLRRSLPKPRPHSPAAWANGYFHQIEHNMSLAFRKTARKDGETEAPVSRWIEYGVYKLLLVAVFLGVANSNETLRQMLDAIK